MIRLPDDTADPELIAKALLRVADTLDAWYEDGNSHPFPDLDSKVSPERDAWSWMYAALLISDEELTTSADLRKTASAIFKGVQGVL